MCGLAPAVPVFIRPEPSSARPTTSAAPRVRAFAPPFRVEPLPRVPSAAVVTSTQRDTALAELSRASLNAAYGAFLCLTRSVRS